MDIIYRSTKEELTPGNLKDLFSSVDYAVCLTPDELFRAVMASTHIVAAWDGPVPVGFIRSMDDCIYSATIDLLLVRPNYRRRGVARALLRHLLAEIEAIRYISVSPNESANNRLYTDFGFQVIDGAGLLQRENV